MARRVISVLVIALLVIAVLGVTSDAGTSRTNNFRVETPNEYSFSPKKAINDETRDLDPGRSTPPPASLGTHTADGGSPGYIIGRSYRDDQAHLNPGRFVDWRHNPHVHFTFAGQLLAGHNDAAIARWIEYTMFDPTTAPNGVFLTNVWLEASPLTTGGWYPNIDVDETNHAIPTGEEFDPADQTRLGTIFWDYSGPGAWGTFVAEPLPQALSLDPTEYMMYPRIEYQEYDGKTIVHVLVNEDYSANPTSDKDAITYWRKELDAARAAGTWTTMMVTDFVWSNHFDISASRVDGKVGLVWIEWPNCLEGPPCDMDGVIHVMESADGGEIWGAEVEITYITDEYQPWVDVNGVYDTDGNIHVVYNASPPGTITPSRVYHWTNRVAGPDGGGTTSLIAIADGFEHYCGRGGSNVGLTGKPVISQCDTLLYVTWSQYGRWQDGDTLDCTADGQPSDYASSVNAEIYVSVSSGLSGGLWDLQRNLTNSHTPDCDSTDANNCDHDAYGTMARYGMNTADYSPTYWGAVPQAFTVRDVLDNSYPEDGYYLDFQYVNDLYPEPARYLNDAEAAVWKYSPIKWFRLPCVQPVIEPRIHISQADYTHPVYWVKNGESPVIDLEIQNLGNAELDVTGITEQTDESWLTVLTASMQIPPATNDTAEFQIDASGFAAGTVTALVATLVVSSNDVNAGDLYYEINTVAADTVILPVWDTITTTVTAGDGLSLTTSSHGNAGNVGEGEVNMDFVSAGDCSEGATVYMYDLCPVIMHSTTQYSWQPFWQTTRTDTVNFQCADNVATEHITTTDYDMHVSGSFVTSDSLIECVKYWIAPANDDDFVLERWDIYPSDEAGSVTGVRIGEWIDWDVPTGGTGNEGGVVNSPTSTDYVYQRGTVDLTAEPPPCLSEDRRYGASGLLGYFTTSDYEADDAVNNNALFGGFIQLDADIFATGSDDSFIPDSAWAYLGLNDMAANNTIDDDQQAWLSFGTFDLTGGDPLHIWIVHATVYDGDEDDLQAVIDRATIWYNDNRAEFHFGGCCGIYSDATWPLGYTGNTNCSIDGKRTLSDITKLIDNVYISKEALCCYASGNTNGSWDEGECKITLSDITKLIDAVYISKNLTEPCISGCER